MAETVTVQKVIGASKPWQDSYGNSNVDWSIQLTDGRTVTRGMREGKSGPNEGDVWEVESWEQKDNYPPKAKGVTFVSGGGGGAPTQTRSQPRSYASSASVRDDPVQILIVRQSSIKAAVEMLEGDRPKTKEEHARGLEDWIAWFENKTWESVGGTPAVSTGAENGRSEGSSLSGTGGEPSGAPSAIDLLKARLEYKVDPDTFSMLVTSVGAESVQGATEEQRAEIMAQLAGLAA